MQFLKRNLHTLYLAFLGIHFNPRTFQEALVRLEGTTAFLLVGLPRSGTSITQAWINQHPQAFVSYESIIEPYIHENNPYRLAAFYYETLRQQGHLVNSFGGSMSKPSIQGANYKLMGNKSIFQQSKRYQKSLLSAINKQPNLKVIFIDRDPKDRIASIINWHQKRDKTLVNTEATSGNLVQIIETECNRSNNFSKFVSQFTQNENVLLLDYQNVASKNLSVDTLFAFMGLDSCNEVDEFFTEKMKATSIEKWRDDLSDEQVTLIDSLT